MTTVFWTRRSLCKMAAAISCLAAMPAAWAQGAETTLLIGVLPNVSARLILGQYQPMRDFFSRELKRGVEIVTAPDFRTFSETTQRGEYHLIVTAPNLGRVAQIDSKWEPLAMYEPRIPALLVAMDSNADSSPAQLRGKSLAMANPQSLVALAGLEWLNSQGLKNGRDFKTVLTANDDSLGAVLRSGEAPLAIMSMGEFRAKPEAVRKSLRIVTEIAKLPGFLVMANPALTAGDRQRLKSLVLAFPKTEDGARFFGLSGFANIREVGESDLKSLDAYLEQTRAGLRPGG
jgi:phosphonate transport system substrate-binding protein